MKDKLHAPKYTTWLISLVFAILGLLGWLITIPILTEFATLFVLVGFVILALGTILKGYHLKKLGDFPQFDTSNYSRNGLNLAQDDRWN